MQSFVRPWFKRTFFVRESFNYNRLRREPWFKTPEGRAIIELLHRRYPNEPAVKNWLMREARRGRLVVSPFWQMHTEELMKAEEYMARNREHVAQNPEDGYLIDEAQQRIDRANRTINDPERPDPILMDVTGCPGGVFPDIYTMHNLPEEQQPQPVQPGYIKGIKTMMDRGAAGDIMGHTYQEFMPKYHAWVQANPNALRSPEDGTIVHRFDGEHEGYTLRTVDGRDQAFAEAADMQNCVAKMADSVDSGDVRLYSLRDKHNNPHANILMNGDGTVVRDIRGKQNDKPNEKYKAMIAQWFATHPVKPSVSWDPFPPGKGPGTPAEFGLGGHTEDGMQWYAKVAAEGDGDAWHKCDCGQYHWGAYGAAGALFRYVDPKGQPWFHLQQRSADVDQPGTWSIPGGAMDSHEQPHEAAMREAFEEMDMQPHAEVTGVTKGGCQSWKYHTVHADVQHPFEAPLTWESQDNGWFKPEEISGMNLHPGFRSFWGNHSLDLAQGHEGGDANGQHTAGLPHLAALLDTQTEAELVVPTDDVLDAPVQHLASPTDVDPITGLQPQGGSGSKRSARVDRHPHPRHSHHSVRLDDRAVLGGHVDDAPELGEAPARSLKGMDRQEHNAVVPDASALDLPVEVVPARVGGVDVAPDEWMEDWVMDSPASPLVEGLDGRGAGSAHASSLVEWTLEPLEGHLSAVKLATQVFYHVAPRSARESILEHGLMGHERNQFTDTPWNYTWNQPKGNYLYDNPTAAKAYAEVLHSKSGNNPTPMEEFHQNRPEGWRPDDWTEQDEAGHSDHWYFQTPEQWKEHGLSDTLEENWYDSDDYHDTLSDASANDDPNGFDIWKVYGTGLPLFLDPEPRLGQGWKLDGRGMIMRDEDGNLIPDNPTLDNPRNTDLGEVYEVQKSDPYDDGWDANYDGGTVQMRYMTPLHVSPQRLELHQHMPTAVLRDNDGLHEDAYDSEVPSAYLQLPPAEIPMPGHESKTKR